MLLIIGLIVVLQVLEVVRGNYDTLTLKLQESLDQYELYAEKPRENGLLYFSGKAEEMLHMGFNAHRF